MGYDLRGAGGAFHWTIGSWFHVLSLAKFGGWEPMGTEGPQWIEPDTGLFIYDHTDWGGHYTSNDGARVTDEDARGLAAGLSAVLDDILDINAFDRSSEISPFTITQTVAPGQDSDEALEEGIRLDLVRVKPGLSESFEYFSGEAKPQLQKFIRYCEQGGFIIV